MSSPVVAEVFQEHHRYLWGLLYRLTGSAADADDLLQETFARALEHPPKDSKRPWRPWLVRVAANLGRDFLRRRRRRGYVGPWLPSPVDASRAMPVDAELRPEGRYELLESVSYAFILALEALSPKQRAVLILRDVLDYPVEATSDALEMSVPNVKTTHFRARRAMKDYDRDRRPLSELSGATRAVLERLTDSLRRRDVAALEALLAAEVRVLSDGGGEFHAARRPIVGRSKVARFFLGLSGKADLFHHASLVTVNGLAALIYEARSPSPGAPPRVLFRCDVDAAGRIREVHAILARRKLVAVPAGGSSS
jgi:RNA polymerase sigma factor (sigma-70 family)